MSDSRMLCPKCGGFGHDAAMARQVDWWCPECKTGWNDGEGMSRAEARQLALDQLQRAEREHAEEIRVDAAGRDVSDLTGLHDESDIAVPYNDHYRTVCLLEAIALAEARAAPSTYQINRWRRACGAEEKTEA